MEIVSIIMPVYNSEEFVSDAIESILAQTYPHFELIAVDDGSTDNSLKIIKQYAKQDDRIKVYSKQNGGISSTRNFGLNKAIGAYVAFIDNDDEYLPNLLEDNVRLIEKYQADIVKFQKVKLYNNQKDLPINDNHTIKYFEEKEIWQNFDTINKFGGTIWNVLYRRNYLEDNHIRFPEASRNEIEDHRFNLECYKSLHKIVCNFKYYYLWKVRTEHSTTGRFIYERFENIKKEGNDLYLFLASKQIDKWSPSFWTKVKVGYLINIMLVMNYDNSGFDTRRNFKEYVRNLKKYELFSRKCSLKDICYLLKNTTFMRTMACVLFDLNMFSLLYVFSIAKLKRDIKKKNRRF